MTTKGVFFKQLIKLFLDNKNETLIRALKQEFGNIDFSAFKNYPADIDLRFQKVLCKIIYGKEDEETHYLLARDYYAQVVSSSIVSKTIFSLCQNEPAKIVPMIVKINNAFTTGMEITCEILDKNKARLRIDNYPFYPQHYQGLFVGATKSLGFELQISFEKINDFSYEYILEWN